VDTVVVVLLVMAVPVLRGMVLSMPMVVLLLMAVPVRDGQFWRLVGGWRMAMAVRVAVRVAMAVIAMPMVVPEHLHEQHVHHHAQHRHAKHERSVDNLGLDEAMSSLEEQNGSHHPHNQDARQRAERLSTVIAEGVRRIRLAARQEESEHADQEAATGTGTRHRSMLLLLANGSSDARGRQGSSDARGTQSSSDKRGRQGSSRAFQGQHAPGNV